MAAKKSKTKSKSATKNVAAKTNSDATNAKIDTKKTLASKATATKSPTKKAVAKKASKKVTAKKKSTAKKTPAKPRSKASSVDGVLKQYQKERVAKESKLVSVRSQIKDLTNKIQSFEKQIVKLKAEQLDTENLICTLDARRDQEVAGLLSSLGINLDSIASAGDAGKKKVDKPTPLFDSAQSDDEDISQEEIEKKATMKPKVDILIAGKD